MPVPTLNSKLWDEIKYIYSYKFSFFSHLLCSPTCNLDITCNFLPQNIPLWPKNTLLGPSPGFHSVLLPCYIIPPKKFGTFHKWHHQQDIASSQSSWRYGKTKSKKFQSPLYIFNNLATMKGAVKLNLQYCYQNYFLLFYAKMLNIWCFINHLIVLDVNMLLAWFSMC